TSAQAGVVRGNHQLGQGMVKRASFPSGGKLLCEKGAVWITVDTGGEDIVLSRGESRGFKDGESIVIEAIGEAEIFVES
ncbi:MAG TPA: DUF2917 domain-containing protein, partial [Terrimicrobiaceae bacterium]